MVANINPNRREARTPGSNILDQLGLERPLVGRGKNNDLKGRPGEHSARTAVADLEPKAGDAKDIMFESFIGRPPRRSATVEDYLASSDSDDETPKVARPDVQWNGMIDHS